MNQGQASRIVNGKFKTISSNVMQICIALELDPMKFASGCRAGDGRARVANSALSIWNGTREDAELLGLLFERIAELRKSGGRRQ